MGLFDKMKTFVGIGAPTITFNRVEDTIPVTDTGIKYNITVASEKELTAIGIKGSLKAIYKNDAGEEKTEIIASANDDGKDWIENQNPFPGKISKTQNWEYAGSVFMEEDKSAFLQGLFANKNKSQLKVILNVEVDIKETGMLFDPSIEKEITLI